MRRDLPGKPWGIMFQGEGTAWQQERVRLVRGCEPFSLAGPEFSQASDTVQTSLPSLGCRDVHGGGGASRLCAR